MLLTREAVYLFGSDSLSWGVMLVFTLLVVWGGLLLCHQEVHDGACRLRYIRARTEYGGYACLVEEVVVLRGDDTTGNHHDVLATEFLQFINHLRHEGLVSCSERRDTQYMHIVLLVGSGDP